MVESGLCHQTSPPWQGKPALCTAVAHGQANILKPLGLPTVVQVWASTEFGQTLLRGTDKIYMHIISNYIFIYIYLYLFIFMFLFLFILFIYLFICLFFIYLIYMQSIYIYIQYIH